MNPELSQFDHLTLPEKLQLVGDLWDHIAGSSEPLPIPDWQMDELDRRKASYLANPGASVNWEEAKRRIRGNGG